MTNRIDKILIALCTSFGLGYSPVAPGTIGSLPAVAIYVLIALLAPQETHTYLIGIALVVTCVLSVILGTWAERYWKTKDPKYFVLDEYAGFFLTVLLFRVSDVFITAIWTFVMTRVFDIIKPPPARKAEVLPGGLGMVADDLISSLYAAGVLWTLWLAGRYLPILFGE